ncbi:Long-chain-fatty-acid--CoA ligase [Thalassocella blandensis]|nr:Long-chain-fatty-acid--CoA ligase [Thalassocella blandensis]
MNDVLQNQQSLVDLFREACDKHSHRPACTCLGKTLSYAQLDEYSRSFAAFLQRYTPLQPGDRLAIQLPNILQYPVVTYGAWRAGLIVVNTNPLYTVSEMEYQFNDAGATALVAFSSMEEKTDAILATTPIKILITASPTDLHDVPDVKDAFTAADKASLLARLDSSEAVVRISFSEALALGSEEELTQPHIDPYSIAALQYTGGTTGVSKGAMLSHRNLVSNTLQMIAHSHDYFREGEEIYVAVLPLYHIYAFSIHCVALFHEGGHSILIPNPRYLPSIVEALIPFKFTGFPGINTLFAALCHDAAFRKLDFSCLRSTASGGMSLSPEVGKQWEALTGVAIAEGYGLSEASPVISANPPQKIQTGTVGLPLPHTEVKVVNADGQSLPANTPGELLVRGPQIMQGYWQQTAATRDVLSDDGWLRTGDIAVIQEDGYLRIVDRLKDLIVVSGFNVYPNEIEQLVAKFPQVRECAAIGVADEKSGEAVKLFIVPATENFDQEALLAFLREKLTAYKQPKHLQILDELPKSNVGKVLKRKLK